MPNTLRGARANAEIEEIALPSLQERKQQLVRDAIWQAATDLFSENGYEETTIEEIAEKAGVSRRTFFRYFNSKSDLMAHGTMNYGISIAAAIDSFPPGYPIANTFRETVLRVARHSVEDPYTRKVMQIAARYPAARAAQLTKMIEVHDHVAVAFARRERASGEGFSPSALAGLTASVLAVTFRIWFEQGKKDITAAAEQVLSTLGEIACAPPAKLPRRQGR